MSGVGFEASREVGLLVMAEELAFIDETVFKGFSFNHTGFLFCWRGRGDNCRIGGKEGSHESMTKRTSNSEANSIFDARAEAHLRILNRSHRNGWCGLRGGDSSVNFSGRGLC